MAIATSLRSGFPAQWQHVTVRGDLEKEEDIIKHAAQTMGKRSTLCSTTKEGQAPDT